MPTFKITDPNTGKIIRITGDFPPTELELNEIFIKTGLEPTTGVFGKVPISEFEKGERNVVGNIFERPAAAVRGGILSTREDGFVKGFMRGAKDPADIPSFQEVAATKASKMASRFPRPLVKPVAFVNSVFGQSVGLGADIVTSPADLIAILAGQLPGVKKGISLLSKTKSAEAVGKFLTKERHLPTRGLFQKAGRAVKKAKASQLASPNQVVKEQIQRVKVARAQTVKKITDETQKKILKSANKIDDEVLKMGDDLQRSAETGSLEFQKRIPKAQRAASNEYGVRLDSISDDLVQRGETITKGDINGVLTSTKEELRSLQLPTGRAETVIDDLVTKKYGTTEFSKNFTLKEVLADTKLIKGQTSSGVKLGIKPFSDDELAVAIFNNKFGQLLEKKAPRLIDLNKSYSPVIRVNKAAHKLFKPRAGELATKQGTGILKKAAIKKVASGKISPIPSLERGERELIRILEEGTEFGKGVGGISEPTKRIGEKIAGREVAKIKGAEAITKVGRIKAEKAVKKFDRALEVLAKREESVAQLVRNKQKVQRIRRLVLIGAIKGAVAITAIKGFLGLQRSINK